MSSEKTACLICGKSPVDKCHIKSKGSGGSTKSFNIVLLCRFHHQEQHKIGILTFIDKYSLFKNELKLKGWEMNGSKLWHKNLVKK